MKIMQVMPVFGFGGAEIMCENLALALQKLGCEVVVVSLCHSPSAITARMADGGIRVVFLHKKQGFDLSCVKELRKTIRNERPDVIHTHLAALKYAALASAGLHCKLIHTLHSIASCEGPMMDQRFNWFLYRFRLARPVALSSRVQATVTARYGLDARDVPVVHNGIDLGKCIRKTDYTIGDTLELLHIGRFDQPKNHPGLIELFDTVHQVYPHSRLTLVGDGADREKIEELVEEKGLRDGVVFYGTTDNVYPLLKNADIFVLPSLWEGMPITIIEAMGTGIPIVASNVGGIPDMLENGRTAILTDVDAALLADAVISLARDEEMRTRIGRAAGSASAGFSASAMALHYMKIYQKETDNGR